MVVVVSIHRNWASSAQFSPTGIAHSSSTEPTTMNWRLASGNAEAKVSKRFSEILLFFSFHSLPVEIIAPYRIVQMGNRYRTIFSYSRNQPLEWRAVFFHYRDYWPKIPLLFLCIHLTQISHPTPTVSIGSCRNPYTSFGVCVRSIVWRSNDGWIYFFLLSFLHFLL